MDRTEQQRQNGKIKMDYIARDTIKEFLKHVIFGADQKIDIWVDAMPAADVQPISGANLDCSK